MHIRKQKIISFEKISYENITIKIIIIIVRKLKSWTKTQKLINSVNYQWNVTGKQLVDKINNFFLLEYWKYNLTCGWTKQVNQWLRNKRLNLHTHVLTWMIYKKTASTLPFAHFPVQVIFSVSWVIISWLWLLKSRKVHTVMFIQPHSSLIFGLIFHVIHKNLCNRGQKTVNIQ